MEDNFLDDYFYFHKHGGPPSEKDVLHHRLMASHLNFMNVYQSILKTYHVPDGYWGRKKHEKMDKHILNQDFEPWVFYSGNKSRRWEWGIDLEDLEEFNNNLPVVMVERAVFDRPNYDHFFGAVKWYNRHLINYLHYLDQSTMEAKTKFARGVGSNYSGFEQPKLNKTLITYNIFTCPKFAKKKIHKKYFGGSCLGHYPYGIYLNRKQKQKDILMELRYGENSEKDWDFEDYEENEYVSDGRKKCYNLQDHYVEQFCFVKRRK